jgi:hypothetical protein
MPRAVVTFSASMLAILTCSLVPHPAPAAQPPGPRSDQDVILDLMERCDKASEKKDWKGLFACTTEDWVRDSVREAELAAGLICVFASIEIDGREAPDPAAVGRKAAASALLARASAKWSARVSDADYRRRTEATVDKSVTPAKRRELRLALSRDCYSPEEVRDLFVRFHEYLLGQATKVDASPARRLLSLRVAGDRATGRFDVGGKTNTYEFRRVNGLWRVDEGPKEETLLERGLSTPALGEEGRDR